MSEFGGEETLGEKRKADQFLVRSLSDPGYTSKFSKEDESGSSSQPINYDRFEPNNFGIMRDLRYSNWTELDRTSFIKRFESAYSRPIEAVINSTVADSDVYGIETTINTTNTENPTMTFMYFIGRLNPPHDGHINGLVALIRAAKEKDVIPLILLGSGPNGGVRTMDNPISFDLKKQFIEEELLKYEYTVNQDYLIQEMSNPARDVAGYVARGLNECDVNPAAVNINQFAGDKGDDTTKLDFAKKAAVNQAKTLFPSAVVTGGVVAVHASASSAAGGEAMSATEVRKDVYKTIINGLGYTGWPQRYKDFYGRFAPLIYDAIVAVARKAGMPAIRTYLGLASEGGSRRKSKTKKTSNLKKRRTQRKKRRTTRRR